jgi:hypothetical protein
VRGQRKGAQGRKGRGRLLVAAARREEVVAASRKEVIWEIKLLWSLR